MRLIVMVIAVVLVLTAATREVLWRIDHPLMQAAVSSPGGSQYAEVRSMPEGSKVPYGSGVFLRSRWTVLRSVQSELTFAGYCSNVGASWQAEQRLRVKCEMIEGEPYVASPSSGGTAVEVAVRRKLAANESAPTDRVAPGSVRLRASEKGIKNS